MYIFVHNIWFDVMPVTSISIRKYVELFYLSASCDQHSLFFNDCFNDFSKEYSITTAVLSINGASRQSVSALWNLYANAQER